ncbi:MAG: hypothetical protein LBF05_02100, partial [Tannerella sp.]|nr:hypothetical protein [Tannerella sp.]
SPGSNLEYTLHVDNSALSITSNGQYAVVTSVDTVRIEDDIFPARAVTKFRCIHPSAEVRLGAWDIRTDTVVVESGSIQPGNATLTITSPTGTDPKDNPMIKPTYQDLEITTSGNLTEAVLLFKYGNITHRLPVRRRQP